MKTRRRMRLLLLLSLFAMVFTVYYSSVWLYEERTESYRHSAKDRSELTSFIPAEFGKPDTRSVDEVALKHGGLGEVTKVRTENMFARPNPLEASLLRVRFGKLESGLTSSIPSSEQTKFSSVKEQAGHGFFKPAVTDRRDPWSMTEKPYNGCRPLPLEREEIYLTNYSSYFFLRRQFLNVFIPKLLIQARELCPTDELFLLIVVPSVTEDFSMRQTVRNTWASPLYGSPWPRKTLHRSMKIIFFLGVRNTSEMSSHHRKYYDSLNLTEETREYGDIVQADFIDSYRNLSLKIATVLHWTRNYCRAARYLLKVDVDTFVNLPLLLELLDHMSMTNRYFVLGHGGQIPQMNAKPITRTGKWGVSVDMYPHDYYPVYLLGHSYVISGDAVKDLLFAYHHMPVVEIEDAFFTGILRKALGLQLIRCWQFAAVDDLRVMLRCFLVENISISQTGFRKPVGLYKVWDSFIFGNCSNLPVQRIRNGSVHSG